VYTELLFYSPVDITKTVVKFTTSLTPVIHRFNQPHPSGVLIGERCCFIRSLVELIGAAAASPVRCTGAFH